MWNWVNVVPVVSLNVPTASCCFGVFFIEGLDDVYYYCPFGIPELVGYKEVIQKKCTWVCRKTAYPIPSTGQSSFSNINKKWYIIYVGKCNVTLYVTYLSIRWSWPYFWWGTEAPAIVTFQGKEVLCFMARCCQMVFPRCDLCESPARFTRLSAMIFFGYFLFQSYMDTSIR